MTDRKQNSREDLVWEEVSTEHVITDEWIDFRRQAFRLPDGSVFEPYYTFSRRDYVVIVPFDLEGKLLCVRQFRQGIREVTTEFPAGGIERGDQKGTGDPAGHTATESALEAAKRELREETGHVSDKWIHLLTIPSYVTLEDNYAHIYMASECRKEEEQELDIMEFLHVERYDPEEIDRLIREGGFQQAVHVMAWLLAKEKQFG